MPSTNWAGNVSYAASSLFLPTTIERLQERVAEAPLIRPLGSMHSFNTVADTTGEQVSLRDLSRAISIDTDARTVTVSGGARYGDFVEELDSAGWAIHNLASLPHISVAGAVATGTHGSGDRNGSLSSAVAGLEMVTADGSVRTVRRGDDDFDGMVVSLGLLGVVTAVTLDIQPTFEVRQDVYENLAWDALQEDFDAITASGYSVSLFTDWSEPGIRLVWVKSRMDDPRVEGLGESFFGATRAIREHHPLPDLDAGNTTPQLGSPGAWWSRLPHFRLGFTPSNGEEIQAEYLVPRRDALAAIDALRGIGAKLRPHLFVSEIRTVQADGLWLSPSRGVDCVAMHFTFMRHPEVADLLPTLDAALAPFGGRPHWGKVFETDPTRFESLYPQLPAFRALAQRLDPAGKFRNEFVDRWVFPS